MKILVVGAGLQGRAAAFDLLRNAEVEQVGLADRDAATLEEVAAKLDDRRLVTQELDASDGEAVRELFAPYDAALSAVNYWLNLELTQHAIATQTHFCDLGGNNEIVGKQLELDTQAFEAGITVIPDCGLAPGMATILAAHGLRKLDEVRALRIRVGGLPLEPKPPLNYQLVFSIEGLINEYAERAVAIRDGVKLSLESLTEVEEIEFSEPFGKLEAFNTSGGLSTLARTFAGKVPNMDYKTIRYPGHCALMHPLMKLGFFERDKITVGDQELAPRQLSAKLLEKLLSHEGPDVVLVRVTVVGTKHSGRRRLEFELIDHADTENEISAMMRCTAYPASVILQMLASGKIDRRGVVPQERCVPAEDFIEALRQRGLEIQEKQS